jgi:hypothetical protein
MQFLTLLTHDLSTNYNTFQHCFVFLTMHRIYEADVSITVLHNRRNGEREPCKEGHCQEAEFLNILLFVVMHISFMPKMHPIILKTVTTSQKLY